MPSVDLDDFPSPGDTGRLDAVLSVGTDVQTIGEVEQAVRRHGRRYVDRLFTPAEVALCGGYDADPTAVAPRLAGRFCAKESVIKALGVTDRVPGWREIEIDRAAYGAPMVRLTGTAAALAREAGITDVQVSISHDAGMAIAVAFAVGTQPVVPAVAAHPPPG